MGTCEEYVLIWSTLLTPCSAKAHLAKIMLSSFFLDKQLGYSTYLPYSEIYVEIMK